MKRYIRFDARKSSKAAPKDKRKAAPKEVNCWVCYKKIDPTQAVEIGGRRKMCFQHDSAYQLFPKQYLTYMGG